ncbi:hypothetical protein VNO80_15557 [Phaseolus coccineus]|uniref:UBA domain-containing protein n=1 Tax=Phaseolus coccineus TaxID=3886 RepID=A0AAN9MNY4_PHACN
MFSILFNSTRVEGGKRSGKEEKNLLLKGVESIDKALCIENSSSTNSKSSKSLLLDPKSKAKDSKEDNLRKDKEFAQSYVDPLQAAQTLVDEMMRHVSNEPPEQLYASQLSQLQEMGFFDTQENIRALAATSGNVHAVERLLGNSGQ